MDHRPRDDTIASSPTPAVPTKAFFSSSRPPPSPLLRGEVPLPEGSRGCPPVIFQMEAARDDGKKRSPEEEEAAKVHQAFRRSANALSQLYTHSAASQKASFRAGERSAMEYVYQWISSQNEAASVSVAGVLAFVENEIARRGGMAGSPQHPSPQPANGSPSAGVETNTSFGNLAAAVDSQQREADETRSADIWNALPSPSQQNFHPFHPVQWPGYGPNDTPRNGDGARSSPSPENQDSLQGDSSGHSSDMDHDAP
uniref:Uncharacterized protein n=1 Tax=Avena sativa TaxID=4498 RepID=A0ACD5VV22_AVESA